MEGILWCVLSVKPSHPLSANRLQGAPIAGYILAAYGGQSAGFKAYRPAIYYAGSMALASSGLVALVRLRISTKALKKL